MRRTCCRFSSPYRSGVIAAKAEVHVGKKRKLPPINDHLKRLMDFMLATFLRVSDIKNLKNKHITVVKKPDHQYLRMMASGKVAPSPVISLKSAVWLYEDHLKGDPEAYVFFPPRPEHRCGDRGQAVPVCAEEGWSV
jgi:hypothetical protein